MIIALDYDQTYTADPVLWDRFINAAQSQGHDVQIVTMRYPHEPIPDLGLTVVYTGRQAKSRHFKADIWIDDSPGWIFQDAFQ